MTKITLQETLNKKSVSALKDIASACRIKGYTKMKKDKMIEACADALQQEDLFETLAFMLPPESWNFFQKVVASETDIKSKIAPMEYMFTEKLGLMYVEECEDGHLCVVPEEIKALYNRLAEKGLPWVKEFADLIHNYANAAVNLYGAVTQDELVEIINSQNGDITDIDLNFAVLAKRIHFDSDYVLWEEYVVNEDFEDDDFEAVQNLVRNTEGKPRYIPEKSEFLKYADWSYYEKTKQITALSEYLIKECGVAKNDIDDLMLDLHFAFAGNGSMSEEFEVFEEFGIIFEKNQIPELLNLIVECRNSTRLWVNKGHTPNELSKLRRLPTQKTQKIGRNDLCPCGSGKKYKNCHGKNA